MRQITTTVGLMVLVLSLVGCAKNECEEEVDRAQARAEECNIPLGEHADEAAAECAEAEAVSFKCQADCAENAPCSALDASDEEASTAFKACLATCR